MPRFLPLCSSSSGNSEYIGGPAGGILIDAGRNAKQLELAMKDAGIAPESVRAVFVTHEHSDHISALRVFAGRYKVPVYASRGTMACLIRGGNIPGVCDPHELDDGESADIGGILVTPFHTSHDSAESFGYRVECGGRVISVATDTGVVTQEVYDGIAGSDLVLIESNHDLNMLRRGPYPEALKRRIRSDIGHLSNDACSTCCASLLKSGTTRFFLGHLSKENNTPELARAAVLGALNAEGAKEETDFTLTVCPPEGCGRYVIV